MGVFFFGMGFSSRATARSLHRLVDPDIPIAGTVREERVERSPKPLPPARLRRRAPGRSLRRRPRKATHVIVSIPPDEAGDPALRQHAPISRRQPTSNGCAISRPSAFMAISAARWSMKPPRPCRSTTQPRRRRGRAGLARLCSGARRAAAHSPPCRHLRPRPLELRQAARRHGAPHRQAGPGVQPHPCRGYRPVTALAALRKLAGTFNLADDEPAPPQDVVAYAAACWACRCRPKCRSRRRR